MVEYKQYKQSEQRPGGGVCRQYSIDTTLWKECRDIPAAASADNVL